MNERNELIRWMDKRNEQLYEWRIPMNELMNEINGFIDKMNKQMSQ